MPIEADRESSHSKFWNDRFQAQEGLFGRRANPFIQSATSRLSVPADVVELGAGEARNLIPLAKNGHRVTAIDFAPDALETARKWADDAGVSIETRNEDLRVWTPDETWDAVLVTFLHLLPTERVHLYGAIQEALRPGGWFFAEWFRMNHLGDEYDRVGPPKADRMLTVDELKRHFAAEGIRRCEAVDRTIDEGPVLNGHCAVLQFEFQKPLGRRHPE